jgi:hypothetical protein
MTAKWKAALKHLRLGMQVKVTATASIEEHPEGRRAWRRRCMYALLPEPMFGVVIGAVYRSEGILRYAPGRIDEGAGNRLEIDNRVLLVKVATSWSSKPIEAAPSNVLSTEPPFLRGPSLPWSGYSMPADMREAVSNDSKNWPRDERGRFIPEGQ